MKMASRAEKGKGERSLREWRTCCHHSVEHKWDCVGGEVQWPNHA